MGGGLGGVTNHRLRSIITDTIQKHNLGESQLEESKTNSCAFKKPLKSDSEKSERPIHNTKYQVQSKDKALEDPAAPPPHTPPHAQPQDSKWSTTEGEGGEGKLKIKTRQTRINEDIKPAEVSCCGCVRCSYSTLDPDSPQIHGNTEDWFILWGGGWLCVVKRN